MILNGNGLLDLCGQRVFAQHSPPPLNYNIRKQQ